MKVRIFYDGTLYIPQYRYMWFFWTHFVEFRNGCRLRVDFWNKHDAMVFFDKKAHEILENFKFKEAQRIAKQTAKVVWEGAL